jgi:trehalose 6-phosphate phosphatase
VALFLDLDGTLLELAERPALVAADQDVRALLRETSRLTGGATAIITGRTIADAMQILGGALDCIAGLHGLESQISPGVRLRAAAPSQSVRAAVADLRALERAGALGALVEDKGQSVALHFRHAPQSEQSVNDAAAKVARDHGLRLLRGKMIVELLPGDRTKGDAIVEFMTYGPFVGRAPVAVGDDVTDEDAFVAANRLGGFSILVGAARASAANYRLGGVSALRAWLQAGLQEARG